jgi:hypothetical protein
MIDSSRLTLAFQEEARSLAARMTFSDAPHIGPDEKFSKLLASHPLPETEQICYVLDEAFWASLLTEEGRPCRPRLLYLPKQEPARQAVHWLAKPVPLNRNALRKLSPAQGLLGYLVWDYKASTAEITGIQTREGGDPAGLIITALDNGALNIDWACGRLLTVRGGQVDRLSASPLPSIGGALEIVRNLLGNFEPAFLGTVVKAIAEVSHGGALWILREGCAPKTVHIGFSVQQNDMALLSMQYEQRTKWLASIGYLAGTDGAVLVNSRLKVIGFGAFIDIPDEARIVTVYSEQGRMPMALESTKLGGGRHRSAIEFCARFAPAAAFVISEDGRISVTWAANSDALFFAPFSTLGIVTDTIIT